MSGVKRNSSILLVGVSKSSSLSKAIDYSYIYLRPGHAWSKTPKLFTANIVNRPGLPNLDHAPTNRHKVMSHLSISSRIQPCARLFRVQRFANSPNMIHRTPRRIMTNRWPPCVQLSWPMLYLGHSLGAQRHHSLVLHFVIPNMSSRHALRVTSLYDSSSKTARECDGIGCDMTNVDMDGRGATIGRLSPPGPRFPIAGEAAGAVDTGDTGTGVLAAAASLDDGADEVGRLNPPEPKCVITGEAVGAVDMGDTQLMALAAAAGSPGGEGSRCSGLSQSAWTGVPVQPVPHNGWEKFHS